jgi:RNA polymerase sigma-70 factor, ECF subfamily
MADTALRSRRVALPAMAIDTASLLRGDLEQYRRELTGYCYRMLGSGFEAEDATQETLVRAWRNADKFEGRSSVRSWLYRIATNICIDMQRNVQRRARPVEMGPASPPDESHLGPILPENVWISPIPDASVEPTSGDPAEIAEHRETIRLAFILCEVLRWQASEVAELLDTSVAAVNSALQRARATLASLPSDPHPEPLDQADAELLDRYVEAFERYDIEKLVKLLHEDAIQTMPPFAMWLRGAQNIATWMVQPGPSACSDSRVIRTSANGCPAFGQYKPDPVNGGRAPWALQVIETHDGRITGMNFFLDTPGIFPLFGLPSRLDG